MDMNVNTDEVKQVTAEQPQAQPEVPAKPLRTKRPTLRKAKTPADRVKRERGRVQYPWSDLETAVGTVRTVQEIGGFATRDQLAGALKISPTAGNFILKTSAARMFGLVEFANGRYQITNLGHAAIGKDEVKARAARAQSFLNVPLYRRAYDDFRGKPLPPRPRGLESAFAQFGVPAKSTALARQVFDRSAKQAGFFSVDPDRLIEPIIGPAGPAEQQSMDSAAELRTAYVGGTQLPDPASMELDELVRGLLRRLPKTDESWTAEQKAKWLRALSQNLDFVYDLEGDKIAVIEVKDATTN